MELKGDLRGNGQQGERWPREAGRGRPGIAGIETNGQVQGCWRRTVELVGRAWPERAEEGAFCLIKCKPLDSEQAE
jgi:hypothetical protein